MRLTSRIEKIEAVVGPPRPRDLWRPRHPRRKVSESEASEAYLRLLRTFEVETIALAESKPPPPETAARKRDVETLHHWSWQRGRPHDTDVARAQQEAFQVLTDEQLEWVLRVTKEPSHVSSRLEAPP